ncbi:MAG: anaerobic ribonucleoside-triphosphate reductase activating protein [Rikenellaceae bacterium]|nr:anaerobic ribonucleoside-triphosphate reductase activating protein [Rikenellaceae bacterium]
MLRLASYDIVFQEIPGEVTLALNISGCPNGCPGCHSPHLQEDAGEALDEAMLGELLDSYGSTVTCVCFMGGDANPHEVQKLSVFIREATERKLKTGWYSGRQSVPEELDISNFDFIKLGPYIEKSGGLKSPDTNQRFYKIESGIMVDITEIFQA